MVTTMFPVQSGVPVPPVDRRPKQPRRKFPVEGMQPGDMFFVPGKTSKSVAAYISRITKKLPGKYTARHCWMTPVEVNGQACWDPANAGDPGAQEGVGVWKLPDG